MQKLMMTPLVRVEDGKIERLLRGAGSAARHPSGQLAGGGKSRTEETWIQLALRSACLAVSDICLVPARERTNAMVEDAVMRRFTNRHYRFSSGEQFLQTRFQIIGHLQKLFVRDDEEGVVMARFETFAVYVEELDMELSQHFHLIAMPEANKGDYVVRKLVADDNAEAMELYRRMTVVSGMCAFGRLPSRIEALFPLSGKRIVWKPQWRDWQRSLDYMRLVKSMLSGEDSQPVCLPIA